MTYGHLLLLQACSFRLILIRINITKEAAFYFLFKQPTQKMCQNRKVKFINNHLEFMALSGDGGHS